MNAVRALTLLACTCRALSASAEPPAITSLFPAGMQAGQTVEIKLNGKVGTQPVSITTASAGLGEFKLSEKGDQLTLSASAETELGLHWLRFYNAEGASSLLPFLVGSASEIGETEPNNSLEQAQKLESLPITINGTLHKSGEVDTYAVELQEGETLVCNVNANEALASPMDAALQIIGPRGFVIEQNDDDHGFDPLIAYTAPVAGTYYLRIFCFPATPNSTINYAGGADYIYRLTVTNRPFVTERYENSISPRGWNLSEEVAIESPVPQLLTIDQSAIDFVMEDAQADALSVPFNAAGSIEQHGERDKIKIATKKGDSFRVQILARSIGSHLDPHLVIYKPDDTKLSESDDLDREHRDVDFVFKSPAGGEYTLEVRDRYDHGGFRFNYRLRVLKEEPRVELSLAADHFTAGRDKPLEIPITVTRLAGFAEVINFEVRGLAEGAVIEAGLSEAKGDSAKKVTLKIDTKDAAAMNGNVQIVGKFGDNQEVLAQATLKTLELKTSDIWLTIPAEPNEEVKEEKK